MDHQNKPQVSSLKKQAARIHRSGFRVVAAALNLKVRGLFFS
jgi:hypothetical protein